MHATNPLSERLIKFQSKVMAIEDAMAAVKKAFDSDVINLEDYLKTIRQLANKQCKQMIKINKLIKGTSGPNPQDMMGGAPGMPPPQMGQPGMAPGQGMPGMPPPHMGQPGMMPPMGQPGMMHP